MPSSVSCIDQALRTMEHDYANHYCRGRIGYWWSEKKSRKFNVNEFSELCRSVGLELVKINLEKPLEEQGPFDVILHKLSDIVVKAAQGNEACKSQCRNIEEYFKKHPELIVIDPLPNVEKLLDRFRQYKNIVESDLGKEDWVFTPNFVELTTNDQEENLKKLQQAGVDFPFVCKPSIAHGSSYAHQMALIFNKEGLRDISPPCVAQSFINHNAVLYKLFIVGRKYFVIERPSLKNFCRCDLETIFFDSHDISKPHSASVLTELDDSDAGPMWRPEKHFLDTIVEVMQRQLGLSLFGIDVIIENATGRYAIIDMNAFPGYDGVDNCLELLRDLVLDHLNDQMRNTLGTPPCANNTINEDDPLELSDSSPPTQSSHISSCFKSLGITCQQRCYCCPVVPPGSVYPELCRKKLSSSSHKLEDSNLSSSEYGTEEVYKPSGVPASMTEEFLTIDSCQDDSGIDTSDSCDEKKNKPLPLRAIKRFHSRTHSALGTIVIPVKSNDAS